MHRLGTGLGAAAGLAAAGALGFAVPPCPPSALRPGPDLGRVRLRKDLPRLLRDHLDPDGDGLVPKLETMALWGRPKMRRGPGPWLPLRMRNIHRIGHDIVSDLDLTWYGRPVLHIVDAFVDGHGLSRIGGHDIVGDDIDQGANLFLWAEAALVPSVFAEGGPVTAEQEDPWTVRLTVPLGAGTDTAWLRFSDGHPSRFFALRYKGQGGDTKIWWHVDFADWRVLHGIPLAARADVIWEDEGRPWLRWDQAGFAPNVAIDRRLAEVAELIHTARAAAGLDAGARAALAA
jgi:Family of unknown function (DUF6544)